MSGEPCVSIVVPAYNHARYLAEAVDSVLRQTYPHVELIVLDDGSMDGTRKVLEGYGARFRWESQPNMGQAATLNKGWAMAKGEILGYVSADDYLHPEAAARAVQALSADPSAVLVYCDFNQVDENDHPIRTIRTPEYDYFDMLVNGTCPPGPGAFLRKGALVACGGWNSSYRRIPDYECWLRLGLLGHFKRIPEVLGSYRIHGAAQSFSPVAADRADEFVRAIDELYTRTDLPAAVASAQARAKANALLYAARLHLMSGRTGQAIARAGEAIRTYWGAALWPRTYRLLLSGVVWRVRMGAS